MKSAFTKDILRAVKNSYSRFLSIMGIVLLGAGVYAGIASISPGMRSSANNYINRSGFMDLRIVSELGITKSDAKAVLKASGVKEVLPAYNQDFISVVGEEEFVFRIHSYSPKSGINKLTLLKGRFPCKVDECVLVAGSYESGGDIGIGSKIKLKKSSETLKHTEYKVVGLVNTPYYYSYVFGTTEKGNGTVDYVAYIPKENFKSKIYTELFVSLSDSAKYDSFSKEYEEYVNYSVSSLKTTADNRSLIRYNQIYGKAKEKINKARKKFERRKTSVLKELDNAKEKIDKGFAQTKKGLSFIAKNEKKLKSGEINLEKNKKAAKEKIKNAKIKLAASQKKLNSQKAKLKEGYDEYEKGLLALEKSKKELDLLKSQIQNLSQLVDNPPAFGVSESELAAIKAQLSELEKLYKSGLEEYEKGLQKSNAAKLKLDEGSHKLEKGYKALSAAKKELKQNREKIRKKFEKAQIKLNKQKALLAKNKNKLLNARKTLKNSKAEYEKNRGKAIKSFEKADKKLKKQEDKLSKIKKPSWHMLTRSSNEGYSNYSGDIQRMKSLATVFPVMFFIVAALVALTTMTRMVDEDRVLIGTYKSLGYKSFAISVKYISYAAVATVIGAVIGILIGFGVIPGFVHKAYSILYAQPDFHYKFDLKIALLSTLLFLACTVSATLFSCVNELREKPASLMLPKAPKSGKRVFLEYITPIWKRLSFSKKVSARNLFLNKKRLVMTIAGIAGCTALLVTGLGLSRSISDVVYGQFKDIFKYNTMIGISEDKEYKQTMEEVKATGYFSELTSAYRKTFEVLLPNGSEKEKISAYLFAAQDPESLPRFITLRDRKTHKEVPFGENSVIITEKLAEKLSVSSGSTIKVKAYEDSGDYKELTVTGITENYVFNYIYISPKAYKSAFGKNLPVNMLMGKCTNSDYNAVSSKISSIKNISTVTFTKDVINTISSSVDSVNSIVLVLIISAGMLAFIVLYNLTNINVSERQRELATLKVLGFYDSETYMYIGRETFILTLIGCLLGLVGGVFLFNYVVVTVEADIMMFGRNLYASSFVFSALLTFLFSLTVSIFINRKINKIDMIESLKSVE